MMTRFQRVSARTLPGTRVLEVSLDVSGLAPGQQVGSEIHDPDTGLLVHEGGWQTVPAGTTELRLQVTLPEQPGRYAVHIGTLTPEGRWSWQHGEPLVLVDATVGRDSASALTTEVLTLRRLRARRRWHTLRALPLAPFRSLLRNTSLIHSLVRRDVQARYRGSFGDTFWTVLHPLLLMATYYFVFGKVLQTRFPRDPSESGFVLYFIAGLLPWIAVNEAVARAPGLMLEQRAIVKKVVFPLDILPANLALTGLVTECFALVLFLLFVLMVRGTLPWTAALLPLVAIPQVLLTAGLCWLLSALGVFFRDLGQIIGLLLTLTFFLTPICYPEAALPAGLRAWVWLNPVYDLVAAYRAILLDGTLPPAGGTAYLCAVALTLFLAGHALFQRLRRMFPDVL